jgi:hypothetical protein
MAFAGRYLPSQVRHFGAWDSNGMLWHGILAGSIGRALTKSAPDNPEDLADLADDQPVTWERSNDH